jgi:UDP-4-amino-4,6-dideoxy-N-acetyl-beta-L-altrosamine transaminase
MIPYGRQEITDEDIANVVRVLKSDFLTQGPEVPKFEKLFSEYIGAKYSVAVSNGTTALHLAALALGVKKGTKVLTTPNSFSASANCVLYCGGEVDFVDIDKNTYLIDLNRVEDKLKKAKPGTYHGIIPVSFAGYPVDTEGLKYITDKYSLFSIEDAAHSLGAEHKNSKGTWTKSGSSEYTDTSIFSFHPVKHLTTAEGGMVTTSNPDVYKKLCLLRTHGITKNPEEMSQNDGPWYYEMQELGYNYRLTELQAALGTSQLSRMEDNLAKRRKIASRYDELLKGLPLTTPSVSENVKHAYHLYVIQTERRLELFNYLRSKEIYCQVHYIPIHTLPYYKNLGWKMGDFPIAEKTYSQSISIPMYHSLTAQDQEFVIETIKDFFKKN